MMRARCPACQTVFRVRPEHLRARQGRVRCGHCQTAFNALEHLLEDEGLAPAEAASGGPTPSPEGAKPPPEERFFVLEEPPAAGEKAPPPTAGFAPEKPPAEKTPTVASLADRLDFDIPETLLPARKPATGAPPAGPEAPAGETPGVAPAVIRPAGRHGSDAAAGPTIFSPGPATAAAAPIDETAPPTPAGAASGLAAQEPPSAPPHAEEEAAARIEPGIAGAEAAPLSATGAEAEDLTRIAPLDETTTPWDRDEETERLDATYGPAPQRRGGRPWLWGMGTGILLGVLAVQSAYLFRGEITRVWPALRPAYLAACAKLGCTLPLPREAGHLGIETSDLESEPSGGGRYVLNAVIRNRADFPQAWPHLELTLTDARDLPAARRVIAPDEWVPQARLGEGFPAGATQAVRLPFEAPQVAAVGYRVYAFYP